MKRRAENADIPEALFLVLGVWTILAAASALVPRPSGFASYPTWIAAIASIGLALGLEPLGPSAPWTQDRLHWVSLVALAPIFEELVYRGRLLPALRARIRLLPAIVASSALFAIPHLDRWSVLGTFLVGLALALDPGAAALAGAALLGSALWLARVSRSAKPRDAARDSTRVLQLSR